MIRAIVRWFVLTGFGLVVGLGTAQASGLKQLQAMERELYGADTEGAEEGGLFKELKTCRLKLATRPYGGTDSLLWVERVDRLSKRVAQMGANATQAALVGQKVLSLRQEILTRELKECRGRIRTQLQTADEESRRPIKIMTGAKLGTDRERVDAFVCDYVKKGAKLSELVVRSLAEGWLVSEDLPAEARLMAVVVRDQTGKEFENGYLLGGWKLAFDRTLNFDEVLSGQDAVLKAWQYESGALTANRKSCMARGPGRWQQE